MMKDWKVRSIIIGTGLGALVGAVTAFLLIRQTEKTNEKPKITPAHGMNIGLGIIGVIRQFLEMGGGKK
jgi:hypothetical protein